MHIGIQLIVLTVDFGSFSEPIVAESDNYNET